MINRTRDLHIHYKKPPSPFIPSLRISKIRNQILSVRSNLTKLRTTLSRHNLPFTRTHVPDLLNLKVRLSQDIILLESYIKDIDGTLGDPIRQYFNSILKTIVIDYRQSEEIHLNSVSKVKGDDGQMLISLSETERIKQSIFFLTTMLMEIKMVVHSQREKIDRIEEYFDKARNDIENTNCVLKEIPRKHNRLKNRIVYFLSIVVVLLLTMSIIKAEKNKMMNK